MAGPSRSPVEYFRTIFVFSDIGSGGVVVVVTAGGFVIY